MSSFYITDILRHSRPEQCSGRLPCVLHPTRAEGRRVTHPPGTPRPPHPFVRVWAHSAHQAHSTASVPFQARSPTHASHCGDIRRAFDVGGSVLLQES